MDPPPHDAAGRRSSPADYWSKLDVIANNRVRFEIFRRFGVFPGSGDHHSVEFMPSFVHPGNDYGADWRVHHYGMEGHRRRRRRRRRALRGDARRGRRDAHAVGRAGRDAARRHRHRQAARAAGEPAERAATSPTCPTARSSRSWASPTATACAAATRRPCPGSWASSCGASTSVQEWTVEAALTGDRTLVLEAMLADPMAGAARLRRHRRDDRRDARGHRPLAPAVPTERQGVLTPASRRHRPACMAPRIVIIGGGSYQWVPKLFVDIVNTPSLAEAELVLAGHQPRAARADGRLRPPRRRPEGHRASRSRPPPTGAPRSKAPTTSSSCISTGGFDEHAPRPRDPGAARHQAVGRRHASGRAGSCARCATSRCSSTSRATWKSSAPTRGCSTSPTR